MVRFFSLKRAKCNKYTVRRVLLFHWTDKFIYMLEDSFVYSTNVLVAVMKCQRTNIYACQYCRGYIYAERHPRKRGFMPKPGSIFFGLSIIKCNFLQKHKMFNDFWKKWNWHLQRNIEPESEYNVKVGAIDE